MLRKLDLITWIVYMLNEFIVNMFLKHETYRDMDNNKNWQLVVTSEKSKPTN